MAVQWPTWRELTCLFTLELKTLCVTETATRPGTITGRGQGFLGETRIAELLAADRLSARLHLSEMVVKPF